LQRYALMLHERGIVLGSVQERGSSGTAGLSRAPRYAAV
jgi:hypothetical protein